MDNQSATSVPARVCSDTHDSAADPSAQRGWTESASQCFSTENASRALLIVDDHAMIRQSLRVLFAADGIHNIIEAVNCEETLRAIHDQDVAVVLLDLRLHEECGLDVLRCIKAMPNPPRVLIHSFHDEAQSLSRCFHAAADGYLVKGTDRDVLLQAVYQAACGYDVWTSEQLQQIETADAWCGTNR